jgi:hypothetical protein
MMVGDGVCSPPPLIVGDDVSLELRVGDGASGGAVSSMGSAIAPS